MFNLFKKKEPPKVEQPARPKPKYITERVYLADVENVDLVYKYIKDDLFENDDYNMTKKELLEDYFDGDRIYKYEPFELELHIEENKVFTKTDGDWLKVGRIKKTDIKKINDKTELYLYPMIYKQIEDDEIEKVTKEPYIALSCFYQKDE